MITHSDNSQTADTRARTLLLVCGILSSLLYVAMNVFVPMQYRGYSSASQTVSELSALDAPTRPLWVLLGFAYTVLVAAFGWGVWASGRRSRALRAVGALVFAYGALGVVWPLAPMHLRGAAATLTDAMHIVLAMATVLLMLIAIGVGATAFGRRFRLYSVASIVVLLGFGALTAMDGPRIATHLPTPWIGVWERISIGVFLLWVVVLAITLLRARASNSRAEQRTPRRVTVFVGSGRKHRSATYAAARQLLDDLESFGDVQGEIVCLSEHNLGLCRGCKVCFTRGEEHCPLGGDRDLLIEKMMTSDGVVFASPNYSFQVSAIMKTFLDRLGFVFHRPCFHGKTFTSIVVQGFYGGGKIEKYLRFIGEGLGFTVVTGSCLTALEETAEKKRPKMEKCLARQSRRFHEQLLKPANRAPSLFRLMGFRMGRTSVKQLLGEGDRDYTYYRDRGWLSSDYFYPTRLGLLKKALGAGFDWFFARVYKRPAAPPPAHDLRGQALTQ